jgi:CBS domain-containing protein
MGTKIKSLKVKDAMNTNPVVAELPGNRRDVLRLFGKHEISGIPVVKAGTRKLQGIVTRSDIFNKINEDQLAIIMNDKPVTIQPQDTIQKAAQLLHEYRIHGIPVVEKGKLVGVISPTDLLKYAAQENGKEIENYLSRLCAPVYEETPITLVLKILCITDAGALPVLDLKGNLVGVVTDGDLFSISHLQEGVAESDIGIGEDEDVWTWEGLRDIMRLYYATSKMELPSVPVKEVMITDIERVYKKSSSSSAAQKMLDRNVSQLPVIDNLDSLVGMIYDVDLMQILF